MLAAEVLPPIFFAAPTVDPVAGLENTGFYGGALTVPAFGIFATLVPPII